uniref:DnaJ homolog subfamily C member 24 n=1 Tax=Castor canadensis TaxID=51338 RepID=A0A8B7URQ9_CASCN|nr:dnaJ homolog subfamily C member 24 [Castor canadensis]
MTVVTSQQSRSETELQASYLFRVEGKQGLRNEPWLLRQLIRTPVYELGNDMVRDVKASEFGSRLDGVESCFTVIAGDYVGANVEYHPDKQSTDVPAETVEECIQKFIEIDQAWKILGNEETKKEYDLQQHADELRNMGPVDAQVYLEEMTWNQDDQSFSLSCRCGGKYTISKDEAEDVNLIACDTCSLVIELLHCC